MRATIDYRGDMDMYKIYLGGQEASIYLGDDGTRLIQVLRLGDEMKPFITLSSEEYRAIAEAILVRESPRLAEAKLLTDTLERERGVSDRLLTLVEQGWAG